MDAIIFHNYVRASLEMTYALESDGYLSELDQLRLENYMAVLQMAYVEWKRRNAESIRSDGPLPWDTTREGDHRANTVTERDWSGHTAAPHVTSEMERDPHTPAG
jgi:hypothetical protein